MCRFDEILYHGYCIAFVETVLSIPNLMSTCQKTRNSSAVPQDLNSDYLALLILSAFVHREKTVTPSMDTVMECYATHMGLGGETKKL